MESQAKLENIDMHRRCQGREEARLPTAEQKGTIHFYGEDVECPTLIDEQRWDGKDQGLFDLGHENAGVFFSFLVDEFSRLGHRLGQSRVTRVWGPIFG